MSWNLTFERQLGRDLLAQVSYVGTRGVHMPNNLVMNLVDPATRQRLDPTIGEIDLSTDSGKRFYDAIQVALRRRLRAAFALPLITRG